MFRLNRNERSHWSGNGVHVESELVFMIGRNMQFCLKLPNDRTKGTACPSTNWDLAVAFDPIKQSGLLGTALKNCWRCSGNESWGKLSVIDINKH